MSLGHPYYQVYVCLGQRLRGNEGQATVDILEIVELWVTPFFL